MFILDINVNIKIGKFYLLNLSKKLIITIFSFNLSILNFYIKILIKHLFFLKIFFILFKNLSKLSLKPFLRMQSRIKYYCLVLGTILVLSIGLRDIKDKKTPKYI